MHRDWSKDESPHQPTVSNYFARISILEHTNDSYTHYYQTDSTHRHHTLTQSKLALHTTRSVHLSNSSCSYFTICCQVLTTWISSCWQSFANILSHTLRKTTELAKERKRKVEPDENKPGSNTLIFTAATSNRPSNTISISEHHLHCFAFTPICVASLLCTVADVAFAELASIARRADRNQRRLSPTYVVLNVGTVSASGLFHLAFAFVCALLN